MSSTNERPGSTARPVRRFLRECVRPYAGLQIQIAACLAIGVVLTLAEPLLLRAIIDHALADGDAALLATLVGLIALALVFRVVFRVISVWLTSYSSLRILLEFRQRCFEHVERLTPYQLRSERLGDVLSRLTSDIDVLGRAASHTVVNAAQDLLTIVGILGVLFWLDPWLATLYIAIAPVCYVCLARVNRRLRAEGQSARESIGGLYTFLEERLSALRLVQEHGREKAQAIEHVRVSRPWFEHNLKLSLLGSVQVSIADLMAAGAFIVVFLVGGMRAIDGALSIGALVAFYTLAARMYRPVAGLVDVNIDLQVAAAALERVYALIDTEPAVREAADARVPDEAHGRIELRGASLRIGEALLLREIDLAIAPGEIVGIVGASGAGKSSLAGLLARNADVSAGEVLVDGLDVRQWKLGALRRHVGFVPQETQLFFDTLAANLRFARPKASDEELLQVLEDVQLATLVRAMPEGLATLVGQSGMRLSGGERQRLALARALLKRPGIHILDEATSALDPLTERVLLERFFERVRGATVIVIAHRLSTLAHVDRVLVVENGQLVESGTHGELLGRPSVYRMLFEQQAREA